MGVKKGNIFNFPNQIFQIEFFSRSYYIKVIEKIENKKKKALI
jgi:hypothetical protein